MSSTIKADGHRKRDGAYEPDLVREEELLGLPRDEFPERGTGMKVAYDLMTNELLLDGSARLNLATFVTTWMPPDAAKLMAETADKNMIDKDEYPQTAESERRCVDMIGRLWHAPGDGHVTGCSTTGSSEAAMLGGLALKWLWRNRRKAEGKLTDRPNLVMGINRQVCWDSSAATGTSSRGWCRWKATATTSPLRKRWRTAMRTPSASWRFSARP